MGGVSGHNELPSGASLKAKRASGMASALSIALAFTCTLLLLVFESQRSHAPASTSEFGVTFGFACAALLAQVVNLWWTGRTRATIVVVIVSAIWLAALFGVHAVNVSAHKEMNAGRMAIDGLVDINRGLNEYKAEHGHLPKSTQTLLLEGYVSPLMMVIPYSGTTAKEVCIGPIAVNEWVHKQSPRPVPLADEAEWYKFGDVYIRRAWPDGSVASKQIIAFTARMPFSKNETFVLRGDGSIDTRQDWKRIHTSASEKGVIEDTRCR